MVTIVYRDWTRVEDHSEAEIAGRLFPDQQCYAAEERRRFELLKVCGPAGGERGHVLSLTEWSRRTNSRSRQIGAPSTA